MWSFKYSANWHQTVFGFPLTIEKFWVMRARMIYLEIETHSSTIKQNRFLTLFNHWDYLYMPISILLSKCYPNQTKILNIIVSISQCCYIALLFAKAIYKKYWKTCKARWETCFKYSLDISSFSAPWDVANMIHLI